VANLVYEPDNDPDEPFYDSARKTGFAEPWLVMVPPMNVHGIVVNDRDEPVAGVVVTGLSAMPSIVTDREGKFALDALPDFDATVFDNLLSLQFDHPDYVQRSISLNGIEDPIIQEDASWRIKLEPGVLLTGATTDAASGQPLAAVWVSARVDVPETVSTSRFRAGRMGNMPSACRRAR
jgi:hypothetical protein